MKTPHEVLAAISAFNAHWHDVLPDYSFAHIVLGDFNLMDGHIDFCLEDEQVRGWHQSKVGEIINHYGENPLSPYLADRYRFTRLLACTDAIIDFLEALKKVPEPIREEAMNIYVETHS